MNTFLPLPIKLLLLTFAASLTLHAQDSDPKNVKQTPFLQPNTWWNFYFDSDQNPLQRGNSSIHAIKILKTDPKRPSWVKITFPKNRQEHFSIFGPAAKASDDEEITLKDALAEWEKDVTQWRVMWVNLRFVSRITKVGQVSDADAPETVSAPP